MKLNYTIKIFGKRVIYSIIIVLIITNVIIFTIRYYNKEPRFNMPISVGSTVNNAFTDINKEVMFVFIKPKCAICLKYHDSINLVNNKFKSKVRIIGICNPKYWDENFIKSYNFRIIEVNNDLRNDLHLAVTPQIIMVENHKVSFSQNFNNEFQYEFDRLKKYLYSKYPE